MGVNLHVGSSRVDFQASGVARENGQLFQRARWPDVGEREQQRSQRTVQWEAPRAANTKGQSHGKL